MPLQWLQLQERQKQQPQRSPVSEALTPRKAGGGVSGAMPQRKGFMEEQRELEAIEGERKFKEKMMKLQHEQTMEKAKFAAGLKEDAQRGITTGQALGRAQAQQQGAARQQIEANPEEAAKVSYEFLLSLPEETQGVLLKQIFTPAGSKSTISAGGKTVSVGGEKLNAIAQSMLDKGQVTMDASGKPILSKPEREFEKATFTIVEKGGKVYKLNTATGEEELLGSTDDPETVNEVVKQINADALALVKTDPSISLPDAKHDAALEYGLDEEAAIELAKFKGIPESAKEKSKFRQWWDKVITSKIETGYQTKGSAPPKPTFDEANVTSLIDVISDDVTTAERAHLKTQGASDSDIEEAIRRKVSK